MTKHYKHPQHILAIDKDYTDGPDEMDLKQGLNPGSEESYKHWLKDAIPHLVIRQRDGLETNPKYRQILPYTIILFADGPVADVQWKDVEVFVYQRTKKVGESRLGGNYSIGVGGHIDCVDVGAGFDSVIDLASTLNTNINREVLNEELEFSLGDGIIVTAQSHPDLFRAKHLGFVRDDSNTVGKVHLGLVNIIVVPKAMVVRCKEQELITVGKMSPKAALASGFKFENWTQILLEALSGATPTVTAMQARSTELDPLTLQHFVLAREVDTLGELAIEFDTTVARLKRMNLHLNSTEGLVVGQRVNVPRSEHDLPAVEFVLKERVPSNVVAGALFDLMAFLTTREKQITLSAADETPPALDALKEFFSQRELDYGEPDILNWHNRLTPTVNQLMNWSAPPEPTTGTIDQSHSFLKLPNPDEEDLKDPIFEAIWQTIKSWDVNAPSYYIGYCGANGSHVKLVLDAVRHAQAEEWRFTLAASYIGDLIAKYLGTPDEYQTSGLRFYVTQDMFERIVKKEERALSLLNAGVLIIGAPPIPATSVLGLGQTTLTNAKEADVEVGFRRQVALGGKSSCARHALREGDSIDSICKMYGIKIDDFINWNGFEEGHAWPTHTGYVFVSDPAENEFARQYREGTRSLPSGEGAPAGEGGWSWPATLTVNADGAVSVKANLTDAEEPTL